MSTKEQRTAESSEPASAGIRSFPVTTMGEFFDALSKVDRVMGRCRTWWRGQAKQEWKVQPSLYHMGKIRDEVSMNLRFRSLAGIRYVSPPASDDLPGWLLLMQHYGIPTRLLDWTRSPLIALLFAVEEEQDSGGTVWGLSPGLLNERQIGTREMPVADDWRVSGVFESAFRGNKTAHSDKIIAFPAPHTDLRQMIQASEFTIHGVPQPLDEDPNAGEFLVRIDVPSTAKEDLKDSLELLGIVREDLFPDLEHLAEEIKSRPFVDTQE